MRLRYAFGVLAALVATVSATVETTEPEDPSVEPGAEIPLTTERHNEFIAIGTFAEENIFGHVVNGEKNKMIISLDNQSGQNITLHNVAGSFHNAKTGKLIKNITAATYNMPLVENVKIQIPYTFHSENKPGETRLNLWIEHTADGVKERKTVYDSIVTIVEPEGSFFDIKMLITYLITLGLLGGLSYYAYITLVPQPKKKRRAGGPSISTATSGAVGQDISSPQSVTATGAGGYQEEWIPSHHMKKPKAGGRKASGVSALSSGDEAATSGAEASATEGRKRKGKK